MNLRGRWSSFSMTDMLLWARPKWWRQRQFSIPVMVDSWLSGEILNQGIQLFRRKSLFHSNGGLIKLNKIITLPYIPFSFKQSGLIKIKVTNKQVLAKCSSTVILSSISLLTYLYQNSIFPINRHNYIHLHVQWIYNQNKLKS